ncbi:MAG: GCD complex subunit gcd7 [Candelina submexicana]|nr:MAG: GCD complex subunit gcd7 [Candelina submexicana]
MAAPSTATSPGLSSFLKSLKGTPVESSIEHLVSLFKRRQIRKSRPCAIATAHLLLRVVSASKWTDVSRLIERIQVVGRRLCAAQPREMVVGNIIRRVLGMIREEAEEDREDDAGAFSDAGTESRQGSLHRGDRPQRPGLSSSVSMFSPLRHGIEPQGPPVLPGSDIQDRADDVLMASGSDPSAQRPPLLTSHMSYAVNNAAPNVTSMFSLLSHPGTPSPIATPPGMRSPAARGTLTPQNLTISNTTSSTELKGEIINGIEEIIDELSQVDDQIASYALEHIHSNEIILTHSSSVTVQKFLLRAATKRKFTVIHAESYPNDHEATHAAIMGIPSRDREDELGSVAFQKPLTAAGITVILIPDSAVFALMSRVNKVILGTHAVVANGGLVAAAGARTIAKAARMHRTPVVIVSGVYKLSPVYPYDFESLIEYGDASKIFGYEDGDLVDKVDVQNPLFDYVPAELVDLYITNL